MKSMIKQYDIIFIDAAKAQSKKFLNITHTIKKWWTSHYR